MILRQLIANDIEAICELEQQWQGSSWNREQIKNEIAFSGSLAFVVEVEGEIVGYVFFRHFKPEAELLRIAVLKNRQRQKIGSKLLQKGLDCLEKKHIEICFLEVRALNTKAITLYLKHGFVKCGKRVGYYKNPSDDALVMKKLLSC